MAEKQTEKQNEPETRALTLTPQQREMLDASQRQVTEAQRVAEVVLAGIYAAAGIDRANPVGLEGNVLTVQLG